MCAAALVKLLRRCVNQMTGKTRQYVDTSIKFEREASQQVHLLTVDIVWCRFFAANVTSDTHCLDYQPLLDTCKYFTCVAKCT